MQHANHFYLLFENEIEYEVHSAGRLAEIPVAAGVSGVPLRKFAQALDLAADSVEVTFSLVETPMVCCVDPDFG